MIILDNLFLQRATTTHSMTEACILQDRSLFIEIKLLASLKDAYLSQGGSLLYYKTQSASRIFQRSYSTQLVLCIKSNGNYYAMLLESNCEIQLTCIWLILAYAARQKSIVNFRI